ncbi:MAG TPA: NADH-quinone oxidoreductase subunit M [Myxococcaceae bacterium]|jgi:NADH-quinone oxidoreductase subunit M|nr:NADH-quinone oxidoreductase subunit M [Myxococcaceae bacterium]
MSGFRPDLLTLVVFAPLLGAALVAFLPRAEKGQIRAWTLVAMLADLALTGVAYGAFDPKGPEFQLEVRRAWIPELGISYHLGVDGLSASLVLLTGFLGPVVVLCSWKFIQERVKEFHLSLLLIQTAMLGTLASLDLILFYVFFEAMLIPMYLLIGVWGSEDRLTAAVTFFLYTLLGSLLMLVAILAIYFLGQPAGARSFDYAVVYNSLLSAHRELAACLDPTTCGGLSPLAVALKAWGPWMFLAFAVAFAIKVPMFPVHTWLPLAHVEAPVAGSVILAGVMLKMGTYGFWRFAIPLFPGAAYQLRPVFVALAVVGIVYGALMCLAQQDVKKLIAYSSVSHLGMCMLGIFALTAEGASGSAYQMLNHGVSTGALFTLFGFLYERRHTRRIADYGGIGQVMPVFAATFVLVTLSSIAVPGTNGFIGEFLVLLGAFRAPSLWIGFPVLATTTAFLGAAYMLWMVQRVFFGPVNHPENAGLRDLDLREKLTAAAFVLVVVFMGLQPQPLLDRIAPSTDRFIARARLGTREASRVRDADVRVAVLPVEGASPAARPPAAALTLPR